MKAIDFVNALDRMQSSYPLNPSDYSITVNKVEGKEKIRGYLSFMDDINEVDISFSERERGNKVLLEFGISEWEVDEDDWQEFNFSLSDELISKYTVYIHKLYNTICRLKGEDIDIDYVINRKYNE